ncbi:MAG: hypothetical protein WBM47_01300 [Polyangiales bacterium]
MRPTASKVEAVTGGLLRLWVFLGMLAASTPIPVVRLGIDPTQMVELIRSVTKGDIARGPVPSRRNVVGRSRGLRPSGRRLRANHWGMGAEIGWVRPSLDVLVDVIV